MPTRTAIGLLRACHPEPTVAVTVMAAALAAASGRSALGSVGVAAAVMAGQLSVGWHNDWLDADRDRAARREDKPIAVGAVHRACVGWGAAMALAATVPLSLISGWRGAGVHLIAVGLAWSYNAYLKATMASFLPYLVAFPLLIAFVSLGLPRHPWPPWWALLTAALLGSGAHLVNAAPDLADDLAAGIRGLPHVLGRRWSIGLACGLLVSATVVVTAGPGPVGPGGAVALGVAVITVVVGVVLGRRPGSRAPFRAALVVAAVDVIALVGRGLPR